MTTPPLPPVPGPSHDGSTPSSAAPSYGVPTYAAPTYPAPSEPTVPARPTRGGGWRLALGIVLVLGLLGSLQSSTVETASGAETAGLVVGRIVLLALGVLLVVSGSRRLARRRRSR